MNKTTKTILNVLVLIALGFGIPYARDFKDDFIADVPQYAECVTDEQCSEMMENDHNQNTYQQNTQSQLPAKLANYKANQKVLKVLTPEENKVRVKFIAVETAKVLLREVYKETGELEVSEQDQSDLRDIFALKIKLDAADLDWKILPVPGSTYKKQKKWIKIDPAIMIYDYADVNSRYKYRMPLYEILRIARKELTGNG